MANKVFQMVADRIMAQLEKGVVPWHRPWGIGDDLCVSHNGGKAYSILNQILLGEPGEYITFNQCTAEGGKVRKGEKSKFVVFWTMAKKKTDELDENGEFKIKTIPILKYYNVFNVNQCEGIETKYYKVAEEREHEESKEAEEVVGLYMKNNPGLRIETEEISNEAYYSPSFDKIVVPRMGQYEDIAEYYSTLFHEMVHSTGHASRLNRFKGKAAAAMFGSEEYSAEELTAEMGSAMLVYSCGLENESTFNNSASYIDGWKNHIKDDPDCVVYAAGRAEKAVRFILGENVEEAA